MGIHHFPLQIQVGSPPHPPSSEPNLARVQSSRGILRRKQGFLCNAFSVGKSCCKRPCAPKGEGWKLKQETNAVSAFAVGRQSKFRQLGWILPAYLPSPGTVGHPAQSPHTSPHMREVISDISVAAVRELEQSYRDYFLRL